MAKLEVTEVGDWGAITVEGKGKFVPLIHYNQKADKINERLKKAFIKGFNESAQGFNAEHGCSDEALDKLANKFIESL